MSGKPITDRVAIPHHLAEADRWRWIALMLSDWTGPAFGLPAHRYQGACPERHNGWASRDEACPACCALVKLEASDAR